MTETRREVKPVEVNLYCDECSKKPNPGCLLFHTGDCYLSYPPRFIYQCPVCEKKFELYKHYPYIDYEEISK